MQVTTSDGLTATITQISADGKVTLDVEPGTITDAPEQLTVSNILESNGNSLVVADASQIQSGMVIFGDGISGYQSVQNVTNNGDGTYTVTLAGEVADFGKGGAMNANAKVWEGSVVDSTQPLQATNNAGNGNNGVDGRVGSAFLNEGEGQDGTNGYTADSVESGYGYGGDGGNGGDGSEGMPFNYQLTKEIIDTTTAILFEYAEATSNFANLPFPDGAEATAHFAAAVSELINLAEASANMAIWNEDLAKGLVARGGAGGDGGEGGAGSDFFGGGQGGDGGDGGAGGLAITDGGDGGNGAKGGAAGFGAGGGLGGEGGAAGPTGSGTDGDPGEGGDPGFGGGVGSRGDGLYGDGGSGFGGAIFVRNGGELVVAGDSVFQNNYALAGSSGNQGSAGEAAGTDIFMMTGSDVLLRPGFGHTIRIEGGIADDSQATYDTAAFAAGDGADLRVGVGGLVQLLGENTYSGKTIVEGATLEADIGTGINEDSHIQFAGQGTLTDDKDDTSITAHNNAGVVLTSGEVTRRVDKWSNAISWTGAGGFAASSEEGLVLNFGAINDNLGQTLKWNSESLADNAVMIFGSEYGQGSVTMINDININGSTANIAVYDSALTDNDFAILAGDLYNGSLRVGDAGYNGTLVLTGDNELQSLTINNGVVTTFGGGSLSSAEQSVDINAKGGTLVLSSNERIDDLTIADGAQVQTLAHVETDDIDNSGTLRIAGGATVNSIINRSSNTLIQDSDVDVSTSVDNTETGRWQQSSDLTADRVTNNGVWNVFADVSNTLDATRKVIANAIAGTGLFNLVTTEVVMTDEETDQEVTKDVQGNLEIDLKDGSSTFDGVIAGAGRVDKTGQGRLQVSNTHTFSGGLEVKAGTFETLAASEGSTGGLLNDSGSISVYDDATFIAGNADTVGSVQIDAGSEETAAGTFNLNADLETQQNVSVDGVLNSHGERTLTTGAGLTDTGAGSGVLNIDSELTLVQSGNTTYKGAISGEGQFIKDGDGTLTLSENAEVDLANGLIINTGKLALDGAGILNADLNVTVNNNGTMALLNGNQAINGLDGRGLIDLGSNILEVNDGGNFEGNVSGSGTLDIKNGNFNVVNNVVSTDGVFNVNTGASTSVGDSSTLAFPEINVQDKSTLEVSGNANASTGVVIQAGGELKGSSNLTQGVVTTPRADVYGSLTGNTRVTGNTIIHAGGSLKPGNSPGIISFGDLNLMAGSATEMEIISNRTAGVDYDQLQIAGQFTITPGAELDIVKLAPGTELTLGEAIQIFSFTPGQVSGQFGNVSSTYTDDILLNLATGQVVGLGVNGLSGLESSVVKNINQRRILDSLEVETNGGVSQFYGGALMPRLAAAAAQGESTDTLFEMFSPEAYASLLDQTRLNSMYALVDLPTSVLDAETGVTLTYTRTDNSTSNGSRWADYDMDSNGIKLQYTANFGMGAITASLGADRTDISSRYLSVDGDGYNASIGLAHLIPAVDGLTVRARVGLSSLSHDAKRTTMTGIASANSIDSDGWLAGLGLGYTRDIGRFRLGANVEAFHYDVEVDGFTESNPNYALDALTLEDQNQSGSGWIAGLNIETTVMDNLEIGVGLGAIQFSDNEFDVTANVVPETTQFTVSNPGLGDTLYTADFSADYGLDDKWSVTLDAKVIGESLSDGNSRFDLGVNYKF